MTRLTIASARMTAAALVFTTGVGAGLLANPDPALATTPDKPADYVKTFSGSYLAARVAQSNRDLSNASVFFQKALESDPDNLHLLEQAFSLSLAGGEMDKALAFAEKLLEADRENRFARLALGIQAIKERSFTGATSQFNRALDAASSELTASLLAAWAKLGAKKPDEALAMIDGLKGPEWYRIFQTFHGGMIAELAGRKDEANRRLAAAYELDSGAIRIVEAYARSLARNGDIDKAKSVLNSYAAQVPNQPLIMQALKGLDEGLTPAPLVKTAQEGASEVLYGIGSAIGSDRGGADELAAIYLQLSLYLHPDSDLARISLGSLYEQLKKHEQAIEVFGGIDAESPMKRNAEIQVGLNYNQLGKLDEAREHLRALVDANPADLEAVKALGSVLRQHKKFSEASVIYSLGIQTIKQPKRGDWWLYYARGITYERTKQWPKAEADFLKALELEPDEPFVLNYLGYSWVDMGMNLDRALKMLQTAVQKRPTDGYIVDSLGWVYYRLGQYDKAVRELERAVELKPDDPVINDHLGDAYWKVGRRLEASFQWSHARDMDPEPDELKKILRKLQVGLEEATTEKAEAADGTEPATTSQ
ncbi:MAG: tetratricopeptide repeat protein [Pseudomonadota bacterium]